MQEPYKEMFIHLHKSMLVLEKTTEKLAEKIAFCLGETAEMYLAHLTELAQEDREDIEKRFAKLFDEET